MNDTIEAARALQDRQVRMRWSDGYEVIANLLSATTDIDGSAHVIYDQVVWSSTGAPDPYVCCYSEADTLVSIEPEPLHDA